MAGLNEVVKELVASKELATFLVAAYAAVLSTIVAVRDYRRNNQRLQIRFAGATLRIRNIGAVPVYLASAGYIDNAWKRHRVNFNQVPAPTDPEANKSLDRGQEIVILPNLTEKELLSAKALDIWWVQDQAGKVFTSASWWNPLRVVEWRTRPPEI